MNKSVHSLDISLDIIPKWGSPAWQDTSDFSDGEALSILQSVTGVYGVGCIEQGPGMI